MKIEIAVRPIYLRNLGNDIYLDVVYQYPEHNQPYMESNYRGSEYGLMRNPIIIYEE